MFHLMISIIYSDNKYVQLQILCNIVYPCRKYLADTSNREDSYSAHKKKT